ncbi:MULTISPECIES: hypothetical protein [unclassified Listeria]|uniref:hypothetical protein n=1 Tax=unclassified Listeria TaxID=2642072 RepID=UPI000B58F6DD|nr:MULTISPECIES: hypothetical protein [unclassified Listeria]
MDKIINIVIKFYRKRRYSMVLTLILTILYLIITFVSKALLSRSVFLVFIEITNWTYLILVTLLMLGLMLAPTYKNSYEYLKKGMNRRIGFEIQAFEIDSNNSYKKKNTYRKLKKIKSSILNLSPEERHLLLSYFEAKNKAPIPVFIPILASFLLGLIGSFITAYFKSPLEMLGTLYITFLLFSGPAINWLLTNQQRKLTEQYIISLIKNAPNNW